MNVRNDYASGGITVAHQQHLVSSVYSIKSILQKHFAQRLHRLADRGEHLPEGRLLDLYSAGYLEREPYEALRALCAERTNDASPPRADGTAVRPVVPPTREAPGALALG